MLVKKIMTQIMKLLEYKHLLVSLKTKELEEDIKQLKEKIIIKNCAKKEEEYLLNIHDLLFRL